MSAVSVPVGEPFTVNAHAAAGGGMNAWRTSAFKLAGKQWKVVKRRVSHPLSLHELSIVIKTHK